MIARRATVIANEIRLRRSQYAGAFIVVEGRHDNLFCRQVVDSTGVKIVVAENKEKVCDTLAILDRDGFAGVVGLVDADFDHLEGRMVGGRNIVVTELHDLECVQLRSGGLDAIVAEFCSGEKLERFGRDLYKVLLAAARPIGCLRLHSERTQMGLRFRDLSYTKFVNREDLSTDVAALVKEVKRHSNCGGVPDQALLEAMRAIEAAGYDAWQLCNGKDLLGVLAIGLRHLLGNQNSTSVRMCKLRQALRLACRGPVFEQTEIHRSLQAWQRRNTGFRLF